ncbi:MAG: radical SAM protein [Candidatus Gracilibacteria bacterium]
MNLEPKIDFVTTVIDTTYLCNDNCAFCFNQKLLNKAPTLSLREMKAKYQQAKQRWGIHQVILSGGEPTLHPEYWEMLDFFYNQNSITTSLNTNALKFADKKFAAEMERFLRKAKNPKKMFSLSLSSVDNFPAKTAKEKLKLLGIKNAIRVAENSATHVVVVIIITKTNYKIIPQLVDFLTRNSSKELVVSLRSLYLENAITAKQKQQVVPPSLAQIKLYIEKALEIALKNPRFKIRLFGLPLCYFWDYKNLPQLIAKRERWHHENRIKIRAGEKLKSKLFKEDVWKMRECENCELKNVCNKIQKEFIEDYAYPRLQPFVSAKLKSVHIVPTYGCNLACSYCYASKFKGKFPQMSWEKFRSVLDKLITNNIGRIVFIGGEPTTWKHLNRAIEVSKSLGMEVVVLTNAVLRMQNLPHAITVNGNNLADPKLCEKILENLKFYRERGVRIGIRFNLNLETIPALMRQYASYARDYADEVSISPIVPYSLSKKLGKILYDFAKLIEKNKQKATFSRALPICIFTPAQLRYLRGKCGLYSVCSPAATSLTINPDATTFPCVDLKIPQKMKSTLQENCVAYNPAITQLKNTPTFAACKKCKHFGVDCQGGCLAMKCNA